MLRSISIVIGFFWVLDVTGQTQFYVSTSGDDNNNGTSVNEAWNTIQHAVNQLNPNSRLNILQGTYNEQISFNKSGSLGQAITLTNYNSDIVLIDGTGLIAQKGIIEIYDYSYIHIDGLIIANNSQLDAQGIIVEGDCQGIEIRNNVIYNINFSTDPNLIANSSRNAQPLIIYGSNASAPIQDLVIENNVIRDSRTGFSEGLAVNGNVDGFSITNNRVYNISNIGIDIIGHEGTSSLNDQARNGTIKNNTVYNCKSPYATAAGIYVDGGRDLVIEANRVFDCQWGIEIGCENAGETTSNLIVRSNIIYNNDDAGIVIGGFDYPNSSGKVTGCQILNNTTYNNDKLAVGIGGLTGEVNISYTENCIIQNNIFHGSNGGTLLLYIDAVNSMDLTLDYNLYNGNPTANFEHEGMSYANFNSYKSGSGQDEHSTFQNPLFRSLQNQDFHLSSVSPPRNSGNPSSNSVNGTEDYDGETRILDSRIDIGANEYKACVSSLILTGDLFSNSYSAIQEIQSTASITQGSIITLTAPEVILNETSIVSMNGILDIISIPCQ